MLPLLPVLAAAVAAPAPIALFEPGLPAAGFLPRARPEAVGVPAARAAALVAASEAASSDALLVIKDGRVIVERGAKPSAALLPTMSITKAVASLAIGMLREEGRIASLDAPMATWLPEWRQDPRKARVTLRHVLTHTSGVGHQTMGQAIYGNADWVAYARALPAEHEPGAKWEYNNAMCELLSEVVRQAAGRPIDRYMAERLFEPLGIARWRWHGDGAGNLDTFGGLMLMPRDLAKVGLLLLDAGRWRGRALVPAAYMHELATPQDPRFPWQGLVWQLDHPGAEDLQTEASLAVLHARGHARTAARLAPLTGKPFPARGHAYAKALRALADQADLDVLRGLEAAGVRWTERRGEAWRTVSHTGWLGQHLLVDPGHRLVAVRMRRVPAREAEQADQARTMPGFADLVADLVREGK